MLAIDTYRNINEALESLDNGGRFYNFKTKAKDGVINQAEVGKVGGVFGSKQQLILFLEMSLLKLNRRDKDAVILKFDEDLISNYHKFKSQKLLPSEAKSNGVLGSNAIITGIPKLVDSKSEFEGFILFPMMMGNISSIMMIPLIDQYDVYELRDEVSSETFLIAHLKESEKLPNKKLILGGVLKELKADEEEDVASGKFLEAIYFIE